MAASTPNNKLSIKTPGGFDAGIYYLVYQVRKRGWDMRALAMITARGGSKRIPRKNIKKFNGKPIIAYSIEAARASGAFEEVMVSTDDADIADIAKEYGASVPFMRSARTSNDFATTVDVIEEVIRE